MQIVTHSEIQASWKALSDPTRRKIIELLSVNALTASEISEEILTSNANISQHLKILIEGNIVNQFVKGNFRIYTINPIGLETALQWLLDFTPSKLKPTILLKKKLESIE